MASTQILQLVGGNDFLKLKRIVHNGTGGNLDLTIQNGGVYCITGYDSISISVPKDQYYTAHLFVTFPGSATEVGFKFPEGMALCGTDPSTAAPSENWEVSIDSVGGALIMRKQAIT